MRRSTSSLVMLLTLSPGAFAVGPPPTCRVRSPELMLARQCYTGDMRGPDEPAMFVGLDETSPVDLNYCFNSLVAPYPTQGAALSLLVLKDDAKGQVVARTFTVSVAALAATLGRVPTNHKAQVLRLNGLTADCYAKHAATDTCSKGFFGWGGTDLPFSIFLENALNGYVVRGGVRDRAIIDLPGVPAVSARGSTPRAQTLDWLTGQVKQRLLNRAHRDLATLTQQSQPTIRAQMNANAGQYRFCRLAFDELNRRLKRPSAFDASELKTFDDLDQALREPGSAAPDAGAAPVVSVPTSASTKAPSPGPASVPAKPVAPVQPPPPPKAAVRAPTPPALPRRPASTESSAGSPLDGVLPTAETPAK